MPVYLDLVGQTQGFQDTDVRARVEGFLESVNFREGSFVRKGDLLYQIEASRDYDPGPDLEKIRAPLLAVNSADDLINPPELGILEREIKRVPKGRAVIVPFSAATAGHGTHTLATVWKQHLQQLLADSAR